ncbi:hypothetical protein K435DRAFT_687700, partial [Dendrothele bispora CBS 962.96]
YLNMLTGELDTLPIVKEILKSGAFFKKPSLSPKLTSVWKGKMDFLQVYDQDDLQLLPAGIWGIREPGAEYNDVKRTNGTSLRTDTYNLAFDRSMVKFGHGKGYYDRYITSYNATGPASFAWYLLLLALREQLLDNATSTNGLVLKGEYDWTMDIIITPDEVLHVNSTKD